MTAARVADSPTSQRRTVVAKRVFLFLATNLAILVMVSIVLAVLGSLGYLDRAGGQGTLLIYCAVWGFGVSFASLLMSRWIAKRATGVQLIDGASGNADLDWLYNTVGNLTRQANLPMPEVGVYRSPEVNAFATGPSKKRSLVAVSTGLFEQMNRTEVEGVLAHEISHIANGDMVTMTLIQGVVNAFVFYLSHVVAGIVRNFLSGDRGRGGGGGLLVYYAVYFAAQILFGLIGSMITAWFSRGREFRADAGAAGLAGAGSMIAALRRLQASTQRVDTQHRELATLKIAGGRSLMQLLATHPPLEARIAALEGRGN
ncbi:MAG: protease HtpX [Acidobacteriota bacterium]|jgi:heat shock protein HtpX